MNKTNKNEDVLSGKIVWYYCRRSLHENYLAQYN